MANDDNLIPLNKRAKSEQREIARLGGIANGEKRREKKDLQYFARIVLDELVKDKKSGVEMPTRYAMVKRLLQKVIKDGDVNAFKAIAQVANEMPKDNTDNNVVVVNIQSSDKGAKAMNELNELGNE